MASGTIKMQTSSVKYASITGTPNQYGSLLYNNEFNAIKDRIVGVVGVSAGGVLVNMMQDNGTHFFGCFKAYPTPAAPYTSQITITVAYI